MRQLLLRLWDWAVMIAVIFGLGEVWRKATIHYVHDVRRRYQFLLIRRIVLWIAILVIMFRLCNPAGFRGTFAGLITAGVAVALQRDRLHRRPLFPDRKYGIRVGDRVQISGVTRSN